ncbi:MAG: hypothetical protein Q8R29_00225 [bacterium]|nr:hypothetical protein [bacterium]
MQDTTERDQLRLDVFIACVILHSDLGTCNRLRTACGIIRDKRLRGVGYNGSLHGFLHCDNGDHLLIDNHCEATIHGEENAIFNTPPEFRNGSTAIVIGDPCLRCAKSLIHAGVKEIICIGGYANARGKEQIDKIAKQAGVIVRPYKIDPAELFQKLFDLLTRQGGMLFNLGYRIKLVKEPLQNPKKEKDQ